MFRSVAFHLHWKRSPLRQAKIVKKEVISLENWAQLQMNLWKIFEIDANQSRKLFFTNLSECFLPKFTDNSFCESNCCPSGVPNSLVYGLQFCCPVGVVTPLGRIRGSVTTPRKTASLAGRCFRRIIGSRHFILLRDDGKWYFPHPQRVGNW